MPVWLSIMQYGFRLIKLVVNLNVIIIIASCSATGKVYGFYKLSKFQNEGTCMKLFC